MLGFNRFDTAAITISGIELAAKIRKHQFKTETSSRQIQNDSRDLDGYPGRLTSSLRSFTPQCAPSADFAPEPSNDLQVAESAFALPKNFREKPPRSGIALQPGAVLLHLRLELCREHVGPLDQISREQKVKGTPYCPFFSFRMSSIPAITIRALWKDLKPSIVETRNFTRRWSCSTMLSRYLQL